MDASAPDSATIAAAFFLARRRMSGVPAKVDGYRVFWVEGSAVEWIDLPAGGPYAILGTHELCDGVLHERGLALRHVLATTVELSDGPALRLLDLQTSLAFRLQDGSEQRSIVGAGAVVARLGGVVFGGVPVTAGRAPAPPPPTAELPEIVVAQLERVELPPTQALPEDPESPPGTPRTRITSLRPSQLITELPPRPAPAASEVRDFVQGPEARGPRWAAGGEPAAPEADGWRVTVEREGRVASVVLTEDDLSVGVVIGRAPWAPDNGLSAVLDTGISRGHILLLHHHGVTEAYDLRSTNGTWEGRAKVLRRGLGDEPVHLSLSSWRGVQLRWHGRERADRG